MDHTRTANRRKNHSSEEIVCPHCWSKFKASQTMAVAMNESLGIDPVAAADHNHNLRYLPSRFSLRGIPLDPSGAESLYLACPNCHLMLSRANLTAKPLFVSVVGAPRAGKTFLLTAATMLLGSTWRNLGFSFSDASTLENRVLREHSQRLFEPDDPHSPIDSLASTDAVSPANSVVVRIRGEQKRLLKPFQFHLKQVNKFLDYPGMRIQDRVVAFYDNPGQDHLPGTREGMDSIRHIAQAKVVIFVLNPLGDKKLRDHCDPSHPLVRSTSAEEIRAQSGQDLVLAELIDRVKTLKGSKPNGELDARIVVVISKSDVLPQMYDLIRPGPTVGNERGLPDSDWINTKRMDDVSKEATARLKLLWPEFFSRAASADKNNQPTVFPVSMVSPEAAKEAAGPTGKFVLTGEMIKPRWVDVPMRWSIWHSLEEVDEMKPSTKPSAGGTPL